MSIANVLTGFCDAQERKTKSRIGETHLHFAEALGQSYSTELSDLTLNAWARWSCHFSAKNGEFNSQQRDFQSNKVSRQNAIYSGWREGYRSQTARGGEKDPTRTKRM